MCQSRSWSRVYLPRGVVSRSRARRVGVERDARQRGVGQGRGGLGRLPGDRQRALDVQLVLDRPGLAGLGPVQGQPVDPARLAVERERPVAGDRPLTAEHRAPDLALEADPGRAGVDRLEHGVERVALQGVVDAHGPRRLVADPPLVPHRDRLAGQQVGQRQRVARALDELQLGPGQRSAGAEHDDPLGAGLGDQQSDLGPEQRARRLDLAVNRRDGPRHPPHHPSRPALGVDIHDPLGEVEPRLDPKRHRPGRRLARRGLGRPRRRDGPVMAVRLQRDEHPGRLAHPSRLAERHRRRPRGGSPDHQRREADRAPPTIRHP